jgi:hypothetical protein
VGEGGCTVYEDRPWACRMYPVAMAMPPARAGFEPRPLYFLAQDDFCHGHECGCTWSVEEWRQNQDVERAEELEQGFREVVSHPWFIGGRKLDPKRCEIFFTACYDLDRFRAFVFESTFLERFEIDDDTVARIREDDEALLCFAFRWLRFALFGEPVLSVRASARRTA